MFTFVKTLLSFIESKWSGGEGWNWEQEKIINASMVLKTARFSPRKMQLGNLITEKKGIVSKPKKGKNGGNVYASVDSIEIR